MRHSLIRFGHASITTRWQLVAAVRWQALTAKESAPGACTTAIATVINVCEPQRQLVSNNRRNTHERARGVSHRALTVIGRATATAFGREGASVLVSGRHDEKARRFPPSRERGAGLLGLCVLG